MTMTGHYYSPLPQQEQQQQEELLRCSRGVSRKRTKRRRLHHQSDVDAKSSSCRSSYHLGSATTVGFLVAVTLLAVLATTTTAVMIAGDHDGRKSNNHHRNNTHSSTTSTSTTNNNNYYTGKNITLSQHQHHLQHLQQQKQLHHRQTERQLQLCDGVCDRYEIGESEITYAGTTVSLAFPLSDLVPDGTVEILTFSDQDCSVDISDNDYLVPEVIYDENPDPTGEKDRNVEVLYTFDPFKIVDKDVWVERDEGQTIFLSFCMAVNLLNGPVGEEGSQAFSRLDTLVFIRVDFEGNFGVSIDVRPGDRLNENALEVYRVDGYWCYENNTRIADVAPLVQGVPVRVCVEPTPRA